MIRPRNKFNRVRLGFSTEGDPVLTRQSMAAECDINNILRKFVKTGAVNHLASYGGEYGFATSISFHEAMNVVAKGKEMFAALPAKLRQRFGGDPAAFLEFVQEPKNLEACRELGLAKPAVPAAADPPPAKVVVVDDERVEEEVSRKGERSSGRRSPARGTVAT